MDGWSEFVIAYLDPQQGISFIVVRVPSSFFPLLFLSFFKYEILDQFRIARKEETMVVDVNQAASVYVVLFHVLLSPFWIRPCI